MLECFANIRISCAFLCCSVPKMKSAGNSTCLKNRAPLSRSCIIFCPACYWKGNLLNITKYMTFAFSVHPLVKVGDQIVTTRLGSTVSLHCSVEASPKSVHFWIKKGATHGEGEKTLQGPPYILARHVMAIFSICTDNFQKKKFTKQGSLMVF